MFLELLVWQIRGLQLDFPSSHYEKKQPSKETHLTSNHTALTVVLQKKKKKILAYYKQKDLNTSTLIK